LGGGCLKRVKASKGKKNGGEEKNKWNQPYNNPKNVHNSNFNTCRKKHAEHSRTEAGGEKNSNLGMVEVRSVKGLELRRKGAHEKGTKKARMRKGGGVSPKPNGKTPSRLPHQTKRKQQQKGKSPPGDRSRGKNSNQKRKNKNKIQKPRKLTSEVGVKRKIAVELLSENKPIWGAQKQRKSQVWANTGPRFNKANP